MSEKEERKKLRKKRMDVRNAVEDKSHEESVDNQQMALRTGYKQVAESIYHLDSRKHSGLQNISSIRVAIDELESKRRIEDEFLKRERLGKLQNEALSSAKANAAIEMRWATLLDKEIPQELHNDIQSQISECNTIIKSKDKLIEDFQKQLRSKDEDYVRNLRHQSDDITELLKRIRREYSELSSGYTVEFDTIEQSYLEERERIVSELTSELDSIFELRKNKEIHYKESKQKREDFYQREVDDLITKGADQFNKLKIELELNIQTLKQQLEEIRATYQLNTEKLDYNYRVLTELDVEKNAELIRYKRRLNKLKDQLNVLITKFNEMESSDSKINSELTSDYRSLTTKYKDLQSKFRHFEASDKGKYDEVWAMHEEEIKDMLDQLLKADQIITEQQIGWSWKAPDMQRLQHVLGRQGNLGITGGNSDGAGAGAGAGEEDKPAKEAVAKETTTTKTRKVSGARVRAVLKMLATEAGFLLNTEVQESIASLPSAEADVQRAEGMLRALGVKSEQSLQTLVNYFFKDTAPESSYNNTSTEPLNPDEEQEQELIDQEELRLHNAPEDVFELKNLIKAEHVIKAVQSYIEDVTVDGSGGKQGGNEGEDARIGQKRLNSMRNYWNQLSQVIPDETCNVWRQLDTDYVTLKELLNKRASSVSEVDQLNQRNTELKRLLNQYLGDQVTNSALQIPPSQVMKVKPVHGGGGKTGGGGRGMAAPSRQSDGSGKNQKVLMSQTR